MSLLLSLFMSWIFISPPGCLQALKAALPTLMWQYNAWYTSAAQLDMSLSVQPGIESSAAACSGNAVPLSAAAGTVGATSAHMAADVAAANDAAGSPGVEPVLSLLCHVPSLLPQLLHVAASAVETEPLLLGGAAVQPLQGGSLQGRAKASLALLQALLEDRRLTVQLLNHVSDVLATIAAIKAAAGVDGGSSITAAARHTAERVQLAKNTADALFGL